MMILQMKNIYCKDIENELKSYHNKTDNRTVFHDERLQNSHNSVQWPVVSTFCQEMKEHRNQKVGSEGTPKLDPHWKLQLVVCTANMELRSESCP